MQIIMWTAESGQLKLSGLLACVPKETIDGLSPIVSPSHPGIITHVLGTMGMVLS